MTIKEIDDKVGFGVCADVAELLKDNGLRYVGEYIEDTLEELDDERQAHLDLINKVDQSVDVDSFIEDLLEIADRSTKKSLKSDLVETLDEIKRLCTNTYEVG